MVEVGGGWWRWLPGEGLVELPREKSCSALAMRADQSSSGSRPASRENRSAYPTSVSDDREMSRKRRNSFRLRREDPSTMLTAAENAARRVCEVRPYCSSLGKDCVTGYTASASW